MLLQIAQVDLSSDLYKARVGDQEHGCLDGAVNRNWERDDDE
jgi:hypothetical protein